MAPIPCEGGGSVLYTAPAGAELRVRKLNLTRSIRKGKESNETDVSYEYE